MRQLWVAAVFLAALPAAADEAESQAACSRDSSVLPVAFL